MIFLSCFKAFVSNKEWHGLRSCLQAVTQLLLCNVPTNQRARNDNHKARVSQGFVADAWDGNLLSLSFRWLFHKTILRQQIHNKTRVSRLKYLKPISHSFDLEASMAVHDSNPRHSAAVSSPGEQVSDNMARPWTSNSTNQSPLI